MGVCIISFLGYAKTSSVDMQIVHVFFVWSSTKFNLLIFTVMKTKIFLMMVLATFLVVGVACTKENDEPVLLENSDPDGTILVSVRNSVNGGTPVELPELGSFYIDGENNFMPYNSNIEFSPIGAVKGIADVYAISATWSVRVAVQEGHGYLVRAQSSNGYKYARLYVAKYILPLPDMVLGAYVKYQSPYDIGSDLSVIIPDENFKSYLMRNFDADSDGKLSQEEADSVREMNCCLQDIRYLDGIELFANLEELYCNNNQLETLDISKNTKLEILVCHSNQLSSLDISANRMLTYLSCSGNPGDGTVFPVTAWFDNTNVPKDFPTSYLYNGKTITIDYKKAN